MKVKKIFRFNAQSEDYIKIVGCDGEIVYIAMDAIVSITVQTNGNIIIRCVQNESYLLQDVSKKQLEDLLTFGTEGEEYEDDEAGDNDLEI